MEKKQWPVSSSVPKPVNTSLDWALIARLKLEQREQALRMASELVQQAREEILRQIEQQMKGQK